MAAGRFSLVQMLGGVAVAAVLLLLLRYAVQYQGIAAGLLVAVMALGVWLVVGCTISLGASTLATLIGSDPSQEGTTDSDSSA